MESYDCDYMDGRYNLMILDEFTGLGKDVDYLKQVLDGTTMS